MRRGAKVTGRLLDVDADMKEHGKRERELSGSRMTTVHLLHGPWRNEAAVSKTVARVRSGSYDKYRWLGP